MTVTAIEGQASRAAEDAARHGYKGREGSGANLLRECARAVRIAARNLEHRHNIPTVSADERADYASDLVARLLGENGGKVPDAADLARSYLIRRAEGIILNDRERYGLDLTEPTAGEAGADPRLDGPLTIPPHVRAAADSLPLTETGKRSMIAAVVPATRREWAEFFGYASRDSWHMVNKRGRRELYAIGEGPLRQALAQAEREAGEAIDGIEQEIRAFMERR
jgi:hypothetical protein